MGAQTLVDLEALACGAVPQPKRRVERGGQDHLAVGREVNVGHGGVIVADERLEARSGGRLPDPAEPVVARRQQQRPCKSMCVRALCALRARSACARKSCLGPMCALGCAEGDATHHPCGIQLRTGAPSVRAVS